MNSTLKIASCCMAVVLIIFFSYTTVNAQCEYWETSAPNSRTNTKPVIDEAGNIYTLVAFTDSTSVNGQTYIADGGTGTGLFLAKHAPDGTYLWTNQITGNFNYVFGGLAYNKVNQKLYAGSSFLTIDFELGQGLQSAVSSGGDPFIIQINPSTGAIEWGKTYDVVGSFGWITGLDNDSNGNIYASGRLNGPMAFTNELGQADTVGVDMIGGSITLLMKIKPDGSHLWYRVSNRVVSGGVAQNSRASVVKVNKFDQVAIAGYFSDSLSFGGSPTLGGGLASFNLYAAKFDSLGNNLWILGDAGTNTNNFEGAYGVDFGDYGETFVAGSSDVGDHIYTKIDSAGNTSTFSATVDEARGVFISVRNSNSVDAGFIYKPGGTSQWLTQVESDFSARVIRVLGQSSSFSNVPLTYNNGPKIETTDSVFRLFVAEYDMDQVALNSVKPLPTQNGTSYGMATNNGKIYVTGPSTSQYLVSSPIGATDFSVYSASGAPTNVPIGSTATINAFGSGHTAFQWYNNGVLLAGETNPSITITDTAPGKYHVKVTNASGCTLSGATNTVSFFATGLAEDSIALVNFYNDFDGINWANQTNWNVGSVDTWFGVTVSGGRVTKLALPGNNVSGTNFNDLRPLTALTKLDLSSNSFGSVYLDGGLYTLVAIDSLDLSNTGLTAEFPNSLSDKSNLSYVNLSNGGGYRGKIDSTFWELPNLTHVEIRGNSSLNLSFPQSSAKTNLAYFDVRGTTYSNTFPSYLVQQTGLTQLYFDESNMSGSLPVLTYPSLTLLDLSADSLEDVSNLANGSSLPALTQINMTSNKIASIPDLAGLGSLTDIFVDGNRLDFSTIELLKAIGYSAFTYTQQSSLIGYDTTVLEGTTLKLDATIGGANNTYLWYKDSVSTGVTTPIYNIASVQATDVGSYYAEVKNTVITDLTISTQPFNIKMETAQKTYFWVGNGGDWADLSHWASTSGGTADHTTLPDRNDLVYFDGNSFTSAGQTVVVTDNGDATGVEFGTMDWSNVTNFPTFEIKKTTSAWLTSRTTGSLIFSQDMTLNFDGAEFEFSGANDYVIDTKGLDMGSDGWLAIGYTSVGDLLTTNTTVCNVLSDLNQPLIYINKGVFNSNGQNIKVIESGYFWLAGDSITVDVSNSKLEFGQFIKSKVSSTFIASNTTFIPHGYIRGNGIQLENVIIGDTVALRNFDYAIDTLNLLPGAVVTLPDGLTTTITNLQAVGTSSNPITIQSNLAGTPAFISQASGTVDAFYLDLKDNTATGGATFNAYRSTDSGGNTNWNFLSASDADSVALATFYEQATGPNWTDNTNWTTGPVSSWFGVGLKGANVASISLPNNNLQGVVAPELATIPTLERLDLSGNFLQTLPDLTQLPNLDTLDVSGNNLDFGSLEANASILEVDYTNQGALGAALDTVIYVGKRYKLIAETGGQNNTYQWRKIQAVGDTLDLQGKTTNTLYLDSLNRSTMGTYICDINNTIVTDLTLQTNTNRVLAGADIAGVVKDSNGQLLDAGEVTLFKVVPGQPFDTVATTAIGGGAAFSFAKAVLADYILLSDVDSIAFPETLPTYWASTILWEEADTLFLNENRTDLEITVSATPPATPGGNGVIAGVVYEDLPDGGRVDARRKLPRGHVVVRRKRSIGKGTGLQEFVYDLIAYVTTNDDGEYSVPGLDPGTYRFNVQYPGIPMDTVNSNIDIEVTADGANVSQLVNATVKETGIVLETSPTGIVDGHYTPWAEVYPVPATQQLNIMLDQYRNAELLIKVTNLAGQLVHDEKQRIEANQPKPLELDISQLEKGVYILEVSTLRTFGKEPLVWKTRFIKTE